MHELNVTLKDKDLRNDLITALNSLHSSKQELEHAVDTVHKITSDQPLRDDVKEILTKANESLTKVDAMFKSPTYGSDLKQTLTSTRAAVGHIDLAARQLNQILEQRSPLMHLLIGRPGLIKDKSSKDKSNKDKSVNDKSVKEIKTTRAVKQTIETKSGTQGPEPKGQSNDQPSAGEAVPEK